MKKIIAIISANLIPICIVIILALLLLNSLDLIDLDDLSPIMTLQEDDSVHISKDADGILAACQKIANYYRDNNFRYNKRIGGYSLKYLEHSHKYSCCTIFAQQALFLAGVLDIDESNWESIWMSKDFGDWLYQNPKWKKVGENEDDAPGDVHIYFEDGQRSHTNIYAGDGQYWDAGGEGTGAFLGTTKTSGQDYLYGVFRYIGSSE